MNELAIVIPAYKIIYFKDTLDSIKNQTCKEFTLYIGDDCSPYNFKELVEEYKDDINIVYKRFDDNLGGKDLVSQWERCISLTMDETWIWLFSDDDIMDPYCVETFYKELEKDTLFDIYHFDVKVINENSKIVRIPTPYPEIITSLDLYKKKSSAKIESFVVENIFSRDIYNKIGGFKNFDLAWGADLATWIMMASRKGMKTIEGAKVLWRKSCSNITPNLNSVMVIRKLNADLTFLSWANDYFQQQRIYLFNKYILFRLFFHYSNKLSHKSFNEILCNAQSKRIINHTNFVIFKISYPVIQLLKQLKDFVYE